VRRPIPQDAELFHVPEGLDSTSMETNPALQFYNEYKETAQSAIELSPVGTRIALVLSAPPPPPQNIPTDREEHRDIPAVVYD